MLREDFIFYVILLHINILLLRGGGVPILAEFIGLQIAWSFYRYRKRFGDLDQ